MTWKEDKKAKIEAGLGRSISWDEFEEWYE